MKFKPYPKYKPTGVEWVGDIPEHWEVKRLKAVVTQVDRKVETKEDLKLRFIGMEDVEPWVGRLLENTTETVPMGMANAFKKGNILFGKLRPYLAKACIAESDGLCSTEFLVLESSALNKRFLLYTLLTEGMVKLIDSSTYGTKMPRASWDFIGNRPVLIPSCEEQEAIVRFLDERTKKVDVLIKRKQALIERLKEKRSALISHTVTKGLPPQAARSAGLPVNPKMKPSGVEWLGDVPEQWEIRRIKDIGSIRYGLGEPPEYVDDGLPFVRATDIKRGKICLDDVKKIRPEDVLWSRGPLLILDEILVVRSGAYTGDSAIISKGVAGSIAGYDMVLTARKSVPAFVAWALLSRYFLEGQIYLERMRAAQPHLNAEQLGGFVILGPQQDEQETIVDFLNAETEKLDSVNEKVERAIERLKQYRSALITATVTGKINIREIEENKLP